MSLPDTRLRLVLDTNVVVAAVRSRTGASNALIGELKRGSFVMLASVPLVIEYESLLSRPEHLAAARATVADAEAFLDEMTTLAEPVRLRYVWRPQLADPDDEMVLDTAINGRAHGIVTFNRRHLGPASRFGIALWSPADVMRRLR